MNDIVERLRSLYTQNGTDYVQEAANEIERLRAELDDAQVSGLKSEASIIKLCAEFNAVEIRCRRMKRAADYYLERAESAELESTRLTAERDRALDRIAAMAAEMEQMRAALQMWIDRHKNEESQERLMISYAYALSAAEKALRPMPQPLPWADVPDATAWLEDLRGNDWPPKTEPTP